MAKSNIISKTGNFIQDNKIPLLYVGGAIIVVIAVIPIIRRLYSILDPSVRGAKDVDSIFKNIKIDMSKTTITEVQAKKPRVPTHVIATGNAPIVRFVGHQNINQNAQYYQPWITKIKAWLDAGKNPSIFFHMPDNKDAPWLAAAFINDYNLTYPDQCLPTLTLPRRKDPATQPTSQQLSIF